MKSRILIADDHGVVAEALGHLVNAEPDMEVVGLAKNGKQAVQAVLGFNPDVVLMDHGMPIMNGTEATRVIRERSSNTRVIMLSVYSDAVHVSRALRAGAAGYVLKKSVAKEVVEAIRTVGCGARYLSKPLADLMIEHAARPDGLNDPLERLSARERQVLQMLAEANTISSIAETLCLSPKTVETYRARIMEKLEIFDLVGLVRFAIQQGVTQVDQ